MIQALFDSPVGSIQLVATSASLLGLVFVGDRNEAGDEHQTLQPCCGTSIEFVKSHRVLSIAVRQLDQYFHGERREFDLDELPIQMIGTDFQKKVWNALLDIPFGETISYGELARRIDHPNASRAVGAANGQNPISILVPCHRVIGANGKLVGYGGGLARKEKLLELERDVLAKHSCRESFSLVG